MGVYPNIVFSPPGPKARELVRRDERWISPSLVRFYPLVVESGEACVVRDVDGNEYIDFNSGLACLNVGHNHSKVVAAVKSQCSHFLHYSTAGFYYREVVDLAERLSEITPGSFDKKVFFGNSGAEAVETAVKLAKWHTRKQLFIGFIGGFHGFTVGTLSFTANKLVQKRYFSPSAQWVVHVPYPYCYRCSFKLTHPECHYWCVDFIDDFVLQRYAPSEDVAAILFEPIQGEGGCVVPPPDYFQLLRKLADKYGILLIDDEVQCGMGRTGKWFAIEHWNVEPDILCIAGALASGLPLSAMVAKAKIMDWVGGSHASTFGGNPLSCVTANAVIEVIKEEKLLDNANKQGAYILKRVGEWKEERRIVGDVRGKGLMIGVEIVEDKESKKPAPTIASEIIVRSWKRGVILVTSGVSTVTMTPPLNITKEFVDAALEIIGDVVKKVEKESF